MKWETIYFKLLKHLNPQYITKRCGIIYSQDFSLGTIIEHNEAFCKAIERLRQELKTRVLIVCLQHTLGYIVVICPKQLNKIKRNLKGATPKLISDKFILYVQKPRCAD